MKRNLPLLCVRHTFTASPTGRMQGHFSRKMEDVAQWTKLHVTVKGERSEPLSNSLGDS